MRLEDVGTIKEWWYKLKCRFWHRYTTVTPRTLPKNRWVDRTALMPHMVFAILTDFLENECGPDCHVAWDRVFTPDGCEETKVIDILWDHYNWWHNDYLVNYDRVYDKWYAHRTTHGKDCFDEIEDDDPARDSEHFEEGMTEWVVRWDTPENEALGETLFALAQKREQFYDQELIRRLKQLMDLHPYMWT